MIDFLMAAGVAEQADAADLKSVGVMPRVGSTPIPGTRGENELTDTLIYYALRGGAVWQLVGLITQRPQVQILPPLPVLQSRFGFLNETKGTTAVLVVAC